MPEVIARIVPLVVVVACGAQQTSSSPTVVDVNPAASRSALDVPDADAPRGSDAQELFRQGREAFANGDYEPAKKRFEAAFAADARPEILYDIGACLEKMGRREEAAATYERYLRADKDISHIDRMSMELRIEQLRHPR